MQEVFVCCAASERAAAEPVVAALNQFDALTATVEICEPGELPGACAAAEDATGVVLIVSPESVPAQANRTLWQPVLQRLEDAPETVAAIELASCPIPPMLRSHGTVLTAETSPRALLRWAAALDSSAKRFELPGFEEQYEYRDVVWIPCAGRAVVSIEEDLAHAVDGRRVLIVLDGPPAGLTIPAVTRERILTQSPLPPFEPVTLTPPVAICYPAFLHRDFCTELAGSNSPGLPAITRDGRILKVPAGSRMPVENLGSLRRAHAELLGEHMRSATPDARLVRLELPAALDFTFATDWNFAAGLAWRAARHLRDRYPRDSSALLLRLRQSAADHKVRSWIDLCEQELRWMGVDIPPAGSGKRKADTRQLTLDW